MSTFKIEKTDQGYEIVIMHYQGKYHLFGNARTALKYGLIASNIQPGESVLVPDFICDVLLHPIEQLRLRPVFYSIDDHMMPDWSALALLTERTTNKALIMVNYFGQPQAIGRYQKFCNEHNLLFIEDNAHGHGGRLNGKSLGTFGDVGISSPRKILGTSSGGILYMTSNPKALIPPVSSNSWSLLSKGLIKMLINTYIPRSGALLRRIRYGKREWSDPRGSVEKLLDDQPIDFFSKQRILATEWENIARRRRINWEAWSKFAVTAGLCPVFENIHPESCPWAIPVYARNLDERNEWLRWGVRTGVSAFSWPSLPESVIQQNGSALARWERLLCFGLDKGPPAEA